MKNGTSFWSNGRWLPWLGWSALAAFPALLLAGVLIRNAANIYFDQNEPIVTNDAIIITETSTQLQSKGRSKGSCGYSRTLRAV